MIIREIICLEKEDKFLKQKIKLIQHLLILKLNNLKIYYKQFIENYLQKIKEKVKKNHYMLKLKKIIKQQLEKKC